jgi:hypothetical protein
MLPILAQTLRSRWLATVVHVSLWILLYAAFSGLQGRAPVIGDRPARSTSPQSLLPGKSLDRLFSLADIQPRPPDTNALSPFFTRHFIKEAAPAPPPPTTRKIELTYHGYWQSAENPIQTIVRLGDSFLITPLGGKITANLFAAGATMQVLTVTNPAGQTNLMPLDVKKEIEVPVQ